MAELARESRHNRRRLKPVIQSLRRIYFTPRGTRKILRNLAEGRRPEQDDIRDVLIDFNDAEWEVRRELDRLDFRELERFGDLSLRQRRTLDEIAYGKRVLRRDLQDALNEALHHDHAIEADDAKVLLTRIEALNFMIESLEEEFL
ncbi:hypothetical protein [Erythrobacter sp.]|uniref:hypothetical protein n=1 Tax=Erythrobacter sp. TaxID=1042 RepID=UPI001B2BB2DB|nr:hypothetical protein [Erythrobacter sp.]MBO6526218.1 hypothetical protein [Erythrobacter sp.]MBO6530471.1 hypothetical protein [Erythrobacter sp.]MBO6769428.1 hypothetical protein [Erythrobacter sp.]